MADSEKRFCLEEVLQDKPQVVCFDLERQITKKRRARGGANEHIHIKRAELHAFELILKQLKELNEKVSRIERR